MIDVIWDMETGDPDDMLTLILLCGHPDVKLKAVTVTPGSRYQVGIVRWVLEKFQFDIPVGAFNIDHPKRSVSSWHYNVFGDIQPSDNAESGAHVIARVCLETGVTMITGGPLKNLGKALAIRNGELGLTRLVAQGGFAGEGVVPSEKQLKKFAGMRTCPTYNLNGDPKSGLAVLSAGKEDIGERYFVSKNVCHGVVYDKALHERVASVKDKSLSMSLIYKGMDAYLRRKPLGKKFHDPLAACCAIEPTIGTWAEVELYRERGKWGAKLSSGSRTMIVTDYNHELFVRVLTKM
jgi:pyrimidine-specific ribonucleoside hydrolase